MACGHQTGCINTVRQDPRIEWRAESASQQLPASERKRREKCVLARWPDAKGTERKEEERENNPRFLLKQGC